MPVFYEMDENVVIIRAVGTHSTADLRQAWLAAETDPNYPAPASRLRICIDARESASLATHSIADIRETVGWFEQRARPTSKLCAWITRPGIQFGLARMMAAWIEYNGYRAFVTTDSEKAMAWLKSQPGPT